MTASRRRPRRDEAWVRPAPAARTARSLAVEERIRVAAARIADPGLRRLFEGTFANTLDTTIRTGGSDARPDTFVVTGDIEAMWLRDSTAQVWPYLASAPDDADLDRLLRGVIHRQSDQLLLDPYANAFSVSRRPGRWALDRTEMRPGVHERKWEPDSLAAFLRLSTGYATATGSLRPFDTAWRAALGRAIATLRTEQRQGTPSPYRFRRTTRDRRDTLPNDGDVAPSRANGMVHCAFRPSDDACVLPLNVPVNLALAAALDVIRPVASAVGADDLAAEAGALAAGIRGGVATDGRVADANADVPIWAYEVDGLGGVLVMDDANAPSLLSLPYLGACAADDPLYRATRRVILSDGNPWWFRGALGDGIGSPHTGPGRIWPLAIAMRGLTAIASEERLACARMLGASHAGTFLAHEAFDPDDPARFSRPWFAWADSVVGEFLERSALDGLLA